MIDFARLPYTDNTLKGFFFKTGGITTQFILPVKFNSEIEL